MKRMKLDIIDLVSLSVFILFDCARSYVYLFSDTKTGFLIDIIFVFTSLVIMLSPFSMRFTKLSFSIAWICLNIVYIIFSQRAFALVNLLLFISYHIIRWLFKRRYNYEFVLPEPSKGAFLPTYSQNEDRISGEEDVRYMKIFIWIGVAIFVICLVLSGRPI